MKQAICNLIDLPAVGAARVHLFSGPEELVYVWGEPS
jgi:hypothetical protein